MVCTHALMLSLSVALTTHHYSLHLAKLDVSNCANVHDACVKFMAPLPNLRECLMRGCDLSDGPLRDVVTVAAKCVACGVFLRPF